MKTYMTRIATKQWRVWIGDGPRSEQWCIDFRGSRRDAKRAMRYVNHTNTSYDKRSNNILDLFTHDDPGLPRYLVDECGLDY